MERLIIKPQPCESDRGTYYSDREKTSQRGRIRNKINPKISKQKRNAGKEKSDAMIEKLSAKADRTIQRAEARKNQRRKGIVTWQRS